MIKQYLRYALYGLVAFLVIAQFFRIDKTNSPVDQSKDYLQIAQPSAEVATLIKVACYDCHSDETNYRWYTNIAPVSWWVKGHIDNGRKKLNYSIWADYDQRKKDHKLEESVEVLEEKRMPMLSYMIAHGDAWISDEERAMLAEWFRQ